MVGTGKGEKPGRVPMGLGRKVRFGEAHGKLRVKIHQARDPPHTQKTTQKKKKTHNTNHNDWESNTWGSTAMFSRGKEGAELWGLNIGVGVGGVQIYSRKGEGGVAKMTSHKEKPATSQLQKEFCP